METLTGKESIWYKEAIRFCRNSGKKSKKRKEVRFTLDDYDKGNICEETAIIRINLTKPWQNHAPINP